MPQPQRYHLEMEMALALLIAFTARALLRRFPRWVCAAALGVLALGLVQPIRQYYRPGDAIVVDGEYHEASTINFYTGLPLLVLHEPSGNLWYGSKFPDAPRVFLTQSGFDSLWAGSALVFLWTDQEDPAELRGKARFLLTRSGGKSILTNHPVSI
jgi:hypothetical protein